MYTEANFKHLTIIGILNHELLASYLRLNKLIYETHIPHECKILHFSESSELIE